MITKSDLSVDQHLFAEASEPTRVPLAEVLRIIDEMAWGCEATTDETLLREVIKRLRQAFAAPTRETEK